MASGTNSADIRRLFLGFFADRGHAIVPSSSLVPAGDPTLLFTNAGMVQFKDVFTGRDALPYRRAVSAQKCVRAGGKHNDLDNVGRTARHHTFFEMLGNFSFGDYFKREAIGFAWKFLTATLGLSPERLWVTIYRDDDEAFDLWREIAGLPGERIVRLGERDNFWSMGDTGPCGPCSEIIFDRGDEFRCADGGCALDRCGCDRWLEIWNLVFMQYERNAEGRLSPLPRPSIDTGMGLERIASVLQGVGSNYDIDLFTPFMRRIEGMTGRRYDPGVGGFPFRVIADHVRACTFLAGDGVIPSNEGRGYVFRRILRRAARFGRVLGLEEPFLHDLVPTVVDVMGDAYPDLGERQGFVHKVIRDEEERFCQTLDRGMQVLEEMLATIRREGRRVIGGDEAFVLYDTYGFPPDLLQDVADEEGLTFDRAGFEAALARQRDRARADRREKMEGLVASPDGELPAGLPPTRFRGYEQLNGRARVLRLIRMEGDAAAGDAEPATAAGDRIGVVLDETPFYAESGGQAGDAGELLAGGLRVEVHDTRPAGHGVTLHVGVVTAGRLAEGQEVEARVDPERRLDTARNHSATHLLHRSLRDILGEHVAQAGSHVAPDRLRFDFTHTGAIGVDELRRIEEAVNRAVLAGYAVETLVTGLEEARAMGATALFGEKYGERVRVVRMGDHSLELCGGTHVADTFRIGLFKITSQESVGAGLRRIEAVTGAAALAYIRRQEDSLREAALLLRARPEEVPARVAEALDKVKSMEKELAAVEARTLREAGAALAAGAREVAGVRVVAAEVDASGADALREMGDGIRAALRSGVVILGSRQDGKAVFLAMVTQDLVNRGFHAGKIVGEVARAAGGGGGGRPDIAQAGARNAERLAEALEAGVAAVGLIAAEV